MMARTFFLLLLVAGAAQSKLLTGELQLDGEVPEHFVSKFSLNQNGTVKGRLETADGGSFVSGSISLFLLDAADWDEYLEQVTCLDRANLAKHRFAIGSPGGQELTKEQEMRATYSLSSHDSTFEFEKDLLIEDGTYVWYIVIADCSLEQIYHNLPTIKYEVTLQNGGSHIPAEEYGLEYVYSVLVLLIGAAGIKGAVLAREQASSMGSTHLILKLLIVAYFVNLLSSICEGAHLWIYALSGEGSRSLNRLAEILQAIFSAIVNFVMLALACGWTLTDTSSGVSFMETFRNPSKMFSWTDVGGISVPAVLATPSSLIVLVFVLSFVVVETVDVMTTNRDDEVSTFHEHDTRAGTVLMALQVVFCGLFLYSLTTTIKLVPPRLRDFTKQLLVAGSVWFLSIPTVVLLAALFPAVMRHRFVSAGTVTLQSGAIISMARTFLSSRGDYVKYSSYKGANLFASPQAPAVAGKLVD